MNCSDPVKQHQDCNEQASDNMRHSIEYCKEMIKMIDREDVSLESWMIDKIAKATKMITSVKHALDDMTDNYDTD